ncbi:MAG: DUF4139 domain-containing protein [Calditrichaeota bacterium]|nr:DUF4139 domain-containing protein [Calditrichota bacterium]MCB9391618.1 DUF4139 domain-containing protein [Calditrichota bacterium]
MFSLFAASLLLFISSTFAKPGVSVTVYNQDLALVRDVREMDFEKGTSQLLFRDVASRIDASSVHFNASGVALLEQNFDFDLVSPAKLLEKYVDQTVEVLTENGDLASGTLMSSVGETILLQMKDGSLRSLLSESILEVRFPKLPDGLITRPTLRWLVNAPSGGKKEAEVSYLTGGMNWNADYVAVIDESNKADFSAWVTLNNSCGASFKDAKLKLIAGEVHRAQQPGARYKDYARAEMLMAADMAPQFTEKSFFEYHLYTLERPTDLLNNQTKQVSLFPDATVQSKRIYEYDSGRDPEKVRVSLEFENSKANDLGIPLPAGRVRVFQRDTDGSQEFIGEDNIDHTPRDEKVRVTIGNAFDIAVERIQKDYRRITDRVSEQDIEVKLRNRKNEPVTIVVVEHSWGDWELTRSSLPMRKVSATQFEFDVDARPDQEVVLSFTIRNR